jgi:excisionase family DNA binding protein
MADEVLTIDEAAIFLKMASKTVRKMLKEGTLPGRQVGRQWRITKRSLLDYIDGGEMRADEEGGTGEKRSR